MAIFVSIICKLDIGPRNAREHYMNIIIYENEFNNIANNKICLFSSMVSF